MYALGQQINVLKYYVCLILSQVGWVYYFARLLRYAYVQHINVLKHFYVFYLDVGSSLRWLTASTMT